MRIKKDVLIARIVFVVFLVIVIAIAGSVVKHVRSNKQAGQQDTETLAVGTESSTEPSTEISDIVVSTGVDYLDTVTYVKTTASVNLRTEASQSSDVIVTVPAETQLQLEDKSLEGWYKVLYTDESGNTQEGFVSADYAEVQETSSETAGDSSAADGTAAEPVYKETTDAVNVRSGPGTDNDKIGSLDAGTQVEIVSESGDWSQVKAGDVTGYVKSEYLK